MNFVYNVVVFIASLLLPILALFNKKINLFVTGRNETFTKIKAVKGEKNIWFHVASLGEFEQARPLIEQLKTSHSSYKIVVTFFSPSGYEIRKNYSLADVVCYLPLDTKRNVYKFVKELKPTMALFVKYEFWPNLLIELKKQKVPTVLVSGILRKNQLFFKSYGGFMKKSLEAFHHFFVQDTNSLNLLASIGFTNVTVAGDTRFDRVSKLLKQDNSLDFISEFKEDKFTLIAGSTWQEDESLLVTYINEYASKTDKFIIAPHTIQSSAIKVLKNSIQRKTVLFSEKEGVNLANYQVLIVDAIGLLTKIYAAADVAYVGGGLKTGLHNILEPATFGVPVIIGNKYIKFKEAVDLVKIGGCISISNQEEFTNNLQILKKDENFRNLTGVINKRYIKDHIGATGTIMNYITHKI